MKYKEMYITPEKAKEMLEKNNSNRKVNRDKVRMYANDMLDGKWQMNGEDIEISESGVLKNGQHRLSAIILCGKPILMGVKYGVPDDVWIYDRGRLRDTHDCLLMKGVSPDIAKRLFVSVARYNFLYLHGGAKVSDSVIEDFIVAHEKSFRTLNDILKGKKNSSKGTRLNCLNASLATGLFYAIEAGVDANVLDDFAHVIHTGFMKNTSQSAAVVLRNDILSGAFRFYAGMDGIGGSAIGMTEKAIMDFVNGYERKVTYRNSASKIYSRVFQKKEQK